MAKKEQQQEPVIVFATLKGPKNLDTLPQVPMNYICHHLALADDFIGLRSLLKVSELFNSNIFYYPFLGQ